MQRFEYPSTRITKKGWGFSLVMFYAEAGDVNTWSGVYRKEISEKGYQRILNDDHANHIRKFLSNDNNVIPNSVVIAFNDKLEKDGVTGQGAEFYPAATYHPVNADGDEDEDTTIENGLLKVRVNDRVLKHQSGDNDITLSDFRSAYVIDGQHRIIGGNRAGRNIYLPVTGFLGVDRQDQAFHFIVINSKARRVSKHDIDAVIPKSIYDGLQQRLVDAGITSRDADIVYGLDNLTDSPFKGLIIWANNPSSDAVIPKGAIDNVIKQIRRLDEDERESLSDSDLELLMAIWRGLKKHLQPLWTSRNYQKSAGSTYPNQLLQKAAAVFPALQRMIVNAIEHGAITIKDDSTDRAKELEDAVYEYARTIPLELFYCGWLKKSITNDAAIGELATLMTKAKKSKKVAYGQGWFAEPQSNEALEKKKEIEREERKKERKAEKAKKKAGKKRRGKKAST